MDYQLRPDHYVASERYAVPGAGCCAVTSVGFMLKDEIDFAYEAVAYKQRLGKTYAGVEVEVGHRHRILKHIPEAFLRVEQE